MPARHLQRPQMRPALRWLATTVGLAVTTAAIFAMAPANASATTTEADLSLSGVATSSSILGGSLIGIHPGDSVDFKASALPTAGLSNVPVLGPLVQSLLSPLLGQYQVVVHLPSNFPGGARSVTLGGPTSGACAGKPDLPIAFNTAGTYNFTWNVQYVLPGLFGCSASGISTDFNLLKSAGIALNATNQWVGQIVVADSPPVGGLGIQLPGLGVAPSLPVVGQLPTLGESGLTVQLPVTLPSVPALPGAGGNKPTAGSGSTTAPAGSSTANTVCVPCEVVPNVGMGSGVGGASGGFAGVGPDANTTTQLGRGLSDGGALKSSPAPVVTSTAAALDSPQINTHVNLAANKAPAAQMPVLLAIIAIIALSLVTATYARLYLLRRNTAV
ncbi:MAG: hypothetical protein M3O28_10635 [Actinomycetota bacterium]|nr:hypothetical protein [Actinomycetota bacterium]